MAARWRMGPAVMRTREPPSLLRVSRDVDRIESRTWKQQLACHLPFMAEMSVHSTMRCDSHATRRVNTHIVCDHVAGS